MRRSIFDYIFEYFEVSKSITDACWQWTMVIDKDYEIPSRYEPHDMVFEDESGQYCILVGFATTVKDIVQDNRRKREVSGFSYGRYIQNRPIRPADRLLQSTISGNTIIIEDPIGYASRIIHGTDNPCGLMKANWDTAVTGWGTSIPYEQFESNEHSRVQNVIDTINAKTSTILHERWKLVNGIFEPCTYLLNETNIDTRMDLPPKLVIENTPDGSHIRLHRMVRDATMEDDATEHYNRIWMDGIIEGTTKRFSTFIPATWNPVTQGPERPYPDCVSLPPTMTDNEARNAVSSRAQMLYNLLTMPTQTYEVPFLWRYDLQLYQKIQFIGFDSIPSEEMRIVQIRFRKDYKGLFCYAKCAVDRQWSAARKLKLILQQDWSKLTSALITAVLRSVPMSSFGTVVNDKGPQGTGIIQTPSGALVYDSLFNQ